MTTRLQVQRLPATNQRPANLSRPSGEMWLNFPDLKLGMINPAQTAVDLLGVRNYAASASYALGDYAVYSGQLQRAKAAIPPRAYSAADWDPLPTQAFTDATYTTQAQNDARYVELAGSTMTGPLVLANDPFQPLQAATKRYVDTNDATRVPLAGGTMTGPLILSGDPASAYQAATKNYVDAVAGNYLPLSGGVLSGTLRVANGRLLSSSSGNNPSVTVWDLNLGYAAGMFLGAGPRLYFGPMDGAGVPQTTWGSFDTSGSFFVNQTLTANYLSSAAGASVGGSGIVYTSIGGHAFEFGWNGNINCYVDGGYQFDIASTGWVNANFATYGWVGSQGYATYNWVNATFYPGTTSDARYLYKTGDSSSGNFTVASMNATYDLTAARDVHCGHLFTHSVSNNSWAFYWDGSASAYVRMDNSADFGPIHYVSDARAKQDIASTELDCLATVNRLTLRQFRMQRLNPAEGTFDPADDDAPTVRVGLIAQEVAEVLPEAVPNPTLPPGGKIHLKTIDPLVMLALLTGAVQQLAKEMETMMPTPMSPDEPLVATLQAQQWNQVLALLGDVPAPHRVTDPLIRALAQQLVQQQEQRTQMFANAKDHPEDNVVPMGAD